MLLDLLIKVARLEHTSHSSRHLVLHWRLPTRCLTSQSVSGRHEHAVVGCDASHYVESRDIVEAHGLSQCVLAGISLSPNFIDSSLVHGCLIPIRGLLTASIPVKVLLCDIDPGVCLNLCIESPFLLLGSLCLSSAGSDPLFKSLLLDYPIVLKVKVVAFLHE